MDDTGTDSYDVVVAGGGIAGLTTALVLGRGRRRVAVVDAGSPRNSAAGHVHGYPGREGMPPRDLIAEVRREAAGYGVQLVRGAVASAQVPDAGPGEVRLEDGRRLAFRHLVLATGLRDVIPDLAGAAERWGRDLLQCPYCHGWETADRPLAVLGTAESSIQQALLVSTLSDDVTLIVQPGLEPDAEALDKLQVMGVDVVRGAARALKAPNDALAAVVLEDGREVPCEAVFCEPGADASSALVEDLGCALNEDGTIDTNSLGATSVARVWAAGNAADPSRQVVTAAGDAYRMAVSLNAILLQEDVAERLAAPRQPAAP